MRLELERLGLHLRRLRIGRLLREHVAEGGECGGRLCEGELAARESEKRFGLGFGRRDRDGYGRGWVPGFGFGGRAWRRI